MKKEFLEQELLKVHSKEQSDFIVQSILEGRYQFRQLSDLFMNSKNPKVAQRAAWPLSYLIEQNPDFIKPHWKEFIQLLDQSNLHPAIHRNLLRSFQFVEIPVKFKGRVMDFCFSTLTDPQAAPAFKAYAIAILEKMAAEYPDILSEFLFILEDQYQNESPAFRSRARPILKKYGKL